MSMDIWYNGSIEDAVAACLQQNKLLVIFLCRQDDQDREFQNRLVNDEVAFILKNKAIALNLVEGSGEYNFFDAQFTVQSLPSVYLLKGGEVRSIFASDLLFDHFKATLNLETSENPPAANIIRSLIAAQQSFHAARDPSELSTSNIQPSVEDLSESQNEGIIEPQSSDQLRERRQRIESEKAAQERRLPDRDNGRPSHSVSQLTYLEILRNRQKQEAEERKTILAQIQSDKEERAARNQRVKPVQTDPTNPPTTSKMTGSDAVSALNIRLLNGSCLKTRMAGEKTLYDVRKYIDEHRTDGDIPYTLVEAHPIRQFGITDDKLTIRELGFCPSTTLILKPARMFANTYNYSYSNSGVLWTVWAFASSLITSFWRRESIPEVHSQQDRHSDGQQQRNRNDGQTVWDNGNSIAQEPPPQE